MTMDLTDPALSSEIVAAQGELYETLYERVSRRSPTLSMGSLVETYLALVKFSVNF